METKNKIEWTEVYEHLSDSIRHITWRLQSSDLQMIKPTVAEEEFEVSQKPNIEDKTIQELLEMDLDMFPVIIVKSFSVTPFKYIKK